MALSQNPLPLRQDVTFFKRAHRLSTPYFLLYWEKLEMPQVSIITPKHQLKTSVQRHRVKRQFRGAIQRLISSIPHSVRLVFIVNRSATTLSPKELEQQILSQFEKIRRLMTAK